MATLKIRDADGNVKEILAIKGDKGDPGEFTGGELLKAHINDKSNPHGSTWKDVGAAPLSANAIDSGWLNDNWYCRKYNDMTELFGWESIETTLDAYGVGEKYIALPIEVPIDDGDWCYISITDYWGGGVGYSGYLDWEASPSPSLRVRVIYDAFAGEVFANDASIHIVFCH